jgi:hypothetical protein
MIFLGLGAYDETTDDHGVNPCANPAQAQCVEPIAAAVRRMFPQKITTSS